MFSMLYRPPWQITGVGTVEASARAQGPALTFFAQQNLTTANGTRFTSNFVPAMSVSDKI